MNKYCEKYFMIYKMYMYLLSYNDKLVIMNKKYQKQKDEKNDDINILLGDLCEIYDHI